MKKSTSPRENSVSERGKRIQNECGEISPVFLMAWGVGNGWGEEGRETARDNGSRLAYPHWPSIISVIAFSGVTALIVCYSRSYSILVASS